MFILKNNPSLRRMRLMRRNFLTPCTNIYNLSLRIVRQMRRGFGTWCTNSYMSDKTPSRCPLDASPKEQGRSMVEMLGVLAIIGVLSVGAIAGYSKAMMKYKLNKHIESFSMLLNEAIKLLPDLQRHYGKNIWSGNNLNNFFYKANLLPDGITYNSGDDYIYDIFKNKTKIMYSASSRIDGTTATDYYMVINMNRAGTKISGQDNEVCRNIFLAAKENAENIASVEMRSLKSGIYDASSLWGTKLRNATLQQIDDACSSCDSEIGCVIILYINITLNH